MSDIVVSISCITYNHAEFIEEAINGFLMQKTNFKFEILIHDDASIDGTTEIIKRYEALYPDIIFPLYEEENQWVKGRRGSLVFNLPRARGKYIAFCEGDDYWIDPFKLQKQVDFLNSNPDYGLTYGRVNVLENDSGLFIGTGGCLSSGFRELLLGNTIPTLSVICRKSLIFRYIDEHDPFVKNWMMGDYPLWLFIASNSKLYFCDHIIGVYRVLNTSASHFTSLSKTINFINNTASIKSYFAAIYNVDILDEIEAIRLYEIYSLILKNKEYKYFDLILSDMRKLYQNTRSVKLLIYIYFSSYPRLFTSLLKVYRSIS